MLSPWWIHVLLAFFTLSGWTVILVTPFSSFRDWPHTGLRGNMERAAVYFLVAIITRGTIPNHETRWQIALLALSAALIEVGRGILMGRSNGITGWASSTAGIVSGAVLMRYVAHNYFWRWGW